MKPVPDAHENPRTRACNAPAMICTMRPAIHPAIISLAAAIT
jgi:hypothetical protein